MNEPRNPYSPPVTRVADREDVAETTDPGRFIPYGRTVSAGRGAAWIGDAWRILKAQPGMWAALLILLFVAYIVASMIPVVNLFVSLLTPFVTAAIALAADQQRRTGTFDLKVMMGGFEKQPVSLLAVGGTKLLAGVVFLVVMVIFLGSDIIAVMTGRSPPDVAAMFSMKFLLAFLVGLALTLPIGFATYLAPQLIVLHDQPAITAMKMSLAGTVRNILPGLVFGLCLMGMMIVSMIPLFLGFLITLPILVITNYTVYRDIFVEDNA
jgi:uncharacterized membrane protein